MATETQRKKKVRQAGSGIVEFTAAAHEHYEPVFDTTFVPGATAAPLGPFDVTAFGYVRSVLLLVTVTGGTVGPAVLHEDGPFNIFNEIYLEDVNGAPIFGPLTGYETFLANLFGSGAAFKQDPRLQADYSDAPGSFSFMLRIPVEIHANNGLGALGNQNAAATYRVRLTGNPAASIWTTQPTAAPTIRVRGVLEAWTQPTPQDLAGRPQAIMPPRHGTTQYWSRFARTNIGAGMQTIGLPRVGNLLRNIIAIYRVGGVRSTPNLPDPVRINWDARVLTNEYRQVRRALMSERFLTSAAGLPAGVLAWDFDHDVLGHGGNGTPELWLPTVQSTRLELEGTFGAGGDITILTNDIAPVEVTQEERYQEFSDTGFHPQGV